MVSPRQGANLEGGASGRSGAQWANEARFERLVERRSRPDGAQVPVAAGTP